MMKNLMNLANSFIKKNYKAGYEVCQKIAANGHVFAFGLD
jgi:hypothetical protein